MEELKLCPLTENLIMISRAFQELVSEYPQMLGIDKKAGMQECVRLANLFEKEWQETYSQTEKSRDSILDQFARRKLIGFAGIRMEPVYFYFGNDICGRYRNGYVVAYGTDIRDAGRKAEGFLKRKGTACFSAWYSQKSWAELADPEICNKQPNDVIW